MSESTYLFRLDALGKTPEDKEKVRRYYWELMTQQHTPLINQLSLKVAQHDNFAKWQSNNAVDEDDLKLLWRSFEKHPQFETMPERAFVAARLGTSNTYSAWLAQQADRQEDLDKLLHSVEVLKTDVELTAISDCDLDVICNRAREVLRQVTTQIADGGKNKKRRRSRGVSIKFCMTNTEQQMIYWRSAPLPT